VKTPFEQTEEAARLEAVIRANLISLGMVVKELGYGD
jgi:hypothetical protein